MTEHARRWRGYHLLEAVCAHHRDDIPWEPLTGPTYAKTIRGVFDPVNGWYDQDAGPKEHVIGPRVATVLVPSLPVYPGEAITVTPASMTDFIDRLYTAGVWPDVRAYANLGQRFTIASYWPSRRAVRWGRAAPTVLRDACLVLADAEPMTPGTTQARALLTSGTPAQATKRATCTATVDANTTRPLH